MKRVEFGKTKVGEKRLVENCFTETKVWIENSKYFGIPFIPNAFVRLSYYDVQNKII